MRYGRLTVIVIVFASFLFAPGALSAQQNADQHQTWEYKVVNYCDPENQGVDEREIIRYLGEDGWELVNADTRQAGETNQCLVHYFKRPKRAEPKQIVNRQTPCSIQLEKAPTIRGLRLGMGADEVLSAVAPNNNLKLQAEAAIKDADLAPNYGLAIFSLYPRSATVMEAKEKFAGINRIDFKTFDGRVVEMNVIYSMRSPDLYPSWTIDEWTAKISNTFNLPGPNYWQPYPSDDQRTLKCKGLEIQAAINPPVYPILPVLGVYRTPSLTIIDPSYRRVLDQRAKSDQEQKQREFVF